jgi:hypothetical protein
MAKRNLRNILKRRALLALVVIAVAAVFAIWINDNISKSNQPEPPASGGNSGTP